MHDSEITKLASEFDLLLLFSCAVSESILLPLSDNLACQTSDEFWNFDFSCFSSSDSCLMRDFSSACFSSLSSCCGFVRAVCGARTR